MNIETAFLPLLDTLVKSGALVLVGAALIAALRKSSAANRHAVSVTIMAALLVLPFTKLMPARWSFSIERPPAPSVNVRLPLLTVAQPSGSQPSNSSVGEVAQPAPRVVRAPLVIPWKKLAVAVWLSGVVLLLARRALIGLRLRSIVRRSFPIEDERLAANVRSLLDAGGVRAEVRESDLCAVPLASGFLRPVVLLPVGATDWSDAFIASALRHELGHVRRRDCITRLLADVLCALYWVNPLVWFAARQMRLAQEQACDDLVLNAGAPADEYAGQLVEVVRSLQGDRFTSRHALAMAQPSTLETRVLAIVDGSRDRSARSLRGTFAGIAFVATMLALCTAAQLRGADEKKTAPAADANAPQVLIDAKFIEFSGKPEELPEMLKNVALLGKPGVVALAPAKGADDALKALEKMKGVDVLSAPRVITRSEQEAKIEAGREMRYATDWDRDEKNGVWVPKSFDTKLVGVTFKVTAAVGSDNTIDMHMVPEVTEFEGFTPVGAANPKKPDDQRKQPIFNTRKIETTVTVKDGQTVVLGGVSREDVQKVEDRNPRTGKVQKREDRIKRQLIVFVTAHILKQDNQPSGTPKPVEAGTAKEAKPLQIVSDEMIFDKKTGALSASGNVKIETAQATITAAAVEVVPKKSGAAAAAEKIIFPKVDFREATLREALDFLVEKSKRLDEKGEGVNIVIRNAEKIGDVKITLNLNNVSLDTALKYIAELTGCEAVAEEFAFVVSPKDAGRVPVVPAVPAMPAGAPVKKADAIVFPKIEFQDASVGEIVEFLAIKSRTLDPAGVGANIILKDPEKIGAAKVTLSLKNIPLAEVLRYVAALANCEVVQEPFAFVVRPAQAVKVPAPNPPAAPAPAERKGAALKKAGTLVLPKLDIREATVAETLDFLREKSKDLDPDKKGLNLVLVPGPAADARITLTLANTPLAEILRYVAALGGYEVFADENVITLRPPAK